MPREEGRPWWQWTLGRIAPALVPESLLAQMVNRERPGSLQRK